MGKLKDNRGHKKWTKTKLIKCKKQSSISDLNPEISSVQEDARHTVINLQGHQTSSTIQQPPDLKDLQLNVRVEACQWCYHVGASSLLMFC